MVLIFFLTTPTRAYEAYRVQNINYTLYHNNTQIKTPVKPQADNELCAYAATLAEQEYAIKPHLLQTISMVESGRWDNKLGKRTAWPWTVHANGKGHYYKSKAEAVAAVKAMQKQGFTNIDVGCMQINLKYHGNAFKSVEDAFEPEKNVSYSAKFLKQLYKRNKADWKKTAMHYHSKNWRKGTNYKNRLEKQYAEYIRPASQTTPLF
ncbi:MAG: transglycosylase SLT domain-containing protein [Acetobacter sp.]|nr:transglycosylase SLT domain-containing protein [Acetobacter sp.]